jgi:hypothetical protein
LRGKIYRPEALQIELQYYLPVAAVERCSTPPVIAKALMCCKCKDYVKAALKVRELERWTSSAA